MAFLCCNYETLMSHKTVAISKAKKKKKLQGRQLTGWFWNGTHIIIIIIGVQESLCTVYCDSYQISHFLLGF